MTNIGTSAVAGSEVGNVPGSDGGTEANRRILIIDDNRAIHEDILKVLAGAGDAGRELENDEAFLFGTEAAQEARFEIDSAFQGKEGLQKVLSALEEGNPYALAFVDMRMPPGWDGIETIGRLWEVNPDLQVVICTAYSDYSWSDMQRHLGNSDSLLILKKPFDNIEVSQLAHALTRKWSLTRQAEQQASRLQAELASRIRAERDLRASEERYALAARGANDGIWDWDLESNAIYFAPRWKEMLGFADSEVDSRLEEWLSRVHPEDQDKLRTQLDEHARTGGPNDFISEHRVRHKDGTWRWMLNRAMVLRSAEGKALRIAGSQTDVTRNRAFDSLTALPNRVLFLESVARALEIRLDGSDGVPTFGVMFIDLDGFKDVNDSLGHSAGDQLLVEVARRLEQTVRSDSEQRQSADIVARFGGDEFAVLLGTIAGHKEATAAANRIQQALAEPFFLRGNSVAISASIGIALWNQAYRNPGEILQDADTAMYAAKRRGRSRQALFDAEMREEATKRVTLCGELRHALERGELTVVYQPIFHLSDTHAGAQSHRLAGFEALVRWQNPLRGLMEPGDFIAVAEECGLTVPLGDFVLREACTRMKQWHEIYSSEVYPSEVHPSEPPLHIAVNLSPNQLRDPRFVARICAALNETGLDPRQLKLEITEAVLIDDFPSVQASVNALKEMGIGFQIDDFGTGYSCLSWLPALRCEALKIDCSFVTSMMKDRHSLEIVRATIGLAENLRMNVIAEGIETGTQLRVLQTLGCRLGQGYYLSKPLSAEDAERLIGGAVDAQPAPTGLDFSAFEPGNIAVTVP